MKTTKVLLYCTKAKPYLYRTVYGKWGTTNQTTAGAKNGYILAECEVETEKIGLFINSINEEYFYTPTISSLELLEKSCLKKEQLSQYLGNKIVCGYALHISDLKVLDFPEPTNRYYASDKYGLYKLVEKAPTNMMRVCDVDDFMYILISIRPEWLCKILNGEKTIEVRRKVLKEML